jgi:hypothetical protein
MARVHSNIFDNFSEEALEALDFARCQRADGSYYGTSGQCRKGKEAGDKTAEQKKVPTAKPSGVSNEQAMKLRASLTKQIGDAAKSRDLNKTNNLMQALAAVEGQLKARGVNLAGGGAMAEAKAGEREIARGEKFIGRARVAMKKLSNERNVAQMRLQIGRMNQIDEAMKRLRKKAEQVGGRLDELTGTKGQGKYYVP